MSLVQFQLQQLRSLEVQAQEMEQLRREMDEITLNWGESFVLERGSERGGRGGGDYHHDHHRHHTQHPRERERERQHHDGGHNQQQQHNKGRQQTQTQAQTQQRRRRQPHRNGAEGMTVTVENELAR